MKNTINACISFSFKGEDYSPSLIIDLDEMMLVSKNLPDFHPILARKNNIDTYSYLYEVMESSDIVFENATGLAVECVLDGQFDLKKFELLWREQHISVALKAIAQKYLAANQLIDCIELHEALQSAYQMGMQAAHKK